MAFPKPRLQSDNNFHVQGFATCLSFFVSSSIFVISYCISSIIRYLFVSSIIYSLFRIVSVLFIYFVSYLYLFISPISRYLHLFVIHCPSILVNINIYNSYHRYLLVIVYLFSSLNSIFSIPHFLRKYFPIIFSYRKAHKQFLFLFQNETKLLCLSHQAYWAVYILQIQL